MTPDQNDKNNRRKADDQLEMGIEAYHSWNIDQAVEHLKMANRLVPNEADYLLHLARALARSGDFDKALRALAGFMQLEPQSPLIERFQPMFASSMDAVETLLTDKMSEADLTIEEIGAAIQAWLEYRIALGREALDTRTPQAWSVALDYTIRKVNLRPVKRRQVAAFYGVSEEMLQAHHDRLVETLDIIPCDYRYFTGDQNPLDKLVEAAELLERLENRFKSPQ